MRLRSKETIESSLDLDTIFREKRKQRSLIRKSKPEQTTNYFMIQHIDIPFIRQFKYFPKHKLIVGFEDHIYKTWSLIDNQIYENNNLNEKLGLKRYSNVQSLSIIESTNTIVKQQYFDMKMIDYDTVQQIYKAPFKSTLYWCKYVAEIVHQGQVIFLNQNKCIVIAGMKNYRINRTIYNKFVGYIDQKKQILLMYGEKIYIYYNTRSRTKLVRSFRKNYQFLISFSGRYFSNQRGTYTALETSLTDITNMKKKAFIYKEDRCLQSLFINELGLFVILYIKSLDIFDSQSFELLGSEQLPDSKLHLKNSFKMVFYESELLIFYQTKRKAKQMKEKDQQEV